jgi:hypothetical protein
MKKELHKIIKEEGLLISLSTSSKTKNEERTSQENQRGRPLDFFVDQFSTKLEVRTAQVIQRGRPFDIFIDQF